jgi:hypothetical protein
MKHLIKIVLWGESSDQADPLVDILKATTSTPSIETVPTQNKKGLVEWLSGSSGRAPAYEAWGPKLNPSAIKKKKKKSGIELKIVQQEMPPRGGMK